MKNLLFLYFVLIFNLDLKPSFFKKIGNFFKSDLTNEEEDIVSVFKENLDINAYSESQFYYMNDSQKNEISQKLYDLKLTNEQSYNKIIKNIKIYNSDDYNSVVNGINQIEYKNNQKKLQEDLIRKNKEIEELRIQESNRLNDLKNKLTIETKLNESIVKSEIKKNNKDLIPKKEKQKKPEKNNKEEKKEQESVNYFDKIVKENEKEEKEEKQKEFALALSKTIENDVESVYSETGKDKFDKNKLLETILQSPKIKEKFDKMKPEKKEQFKKSLLSVIEKKKQNLDNGKWVNYNLQKKHEINAKSGFKIKEFDYSSLLKTFDKDLISEFKKEENFEKNQKLEPQLSKKEIEFIEEEIKKNFLIKRKSSGKNIKVYKKNNEISKKNNFIKKNKHLFNKIIQKNKNNF